MKTPDQIATDLDGIIQRHYYSEDFELSSSLRAYIDGLDARELNLYEQVALGRLMRDGSMVDIMLCTAVRIPSACPILAEKLNREPMSNQLTRVLITALQRYDSDEAYRAVERFLDSDQEAEALQALASIDFCRTIPMLSRLLAKEHLHGVILHIVFERFRAVGMETLIRELQASSATRSPAFHRSFESALTSKKDPYNPFSPGQIRHMIESLNRS